MRLVARVDAWIHDGQQLLEEVVLELRKRMPFTCASPPLLAHCALSRRCAAHRGPRPGIKRPKILLVAARTHASRTSACVHA